MNETVDIKSACEHCGGHIQFPPEGVGLAVDCPHCGWKTQLTAPAPTPAPPAVPPGRARLSRPAVVVVATLLGLAVGAFVWRYKSERRVGVIPLASSSNSAAGTVAPPPRRGFSTNGLAISGIALEPASKGKVVYAVGSVGNELARQRFGLRIELDLFDAGGEKVGTATDYLSVLEPGKEWHFKAMVLESKAVSAKLAGIREDR